MNKITLKILLFVSFILFLTTDLFAATYGAADTYIVKLKKFEISSDGGATFTTLLDGASSTIDIAAGTAGESAGTFMSGLTIPDGTYNTVRVTPHDDMIFSGTASGQYVTSTSFGGGCAPGTLAEKGLCSMSAPAGTIVPSTNTLSPAITVKDGTPNARIRVYFNVSQAVELENYGGGNAFYPAPPVVTIEVEQ